VSRQAADRSRTRALFAIAAAAVVAGAIVALVGTQVPWERVVTPGRTVTEEGATFRFPDTVQTYDADDLGSAATPLAGALLALSLVPLLTGPRARPFAYAACVVLGGFLVGASRSGAQLDVSGTLMNGPGRMLTIIGAALALAGALIAIGPSSGVPRMRIPERAAEETQAAEHARETP
jgi:hypothetical protein